MKKRAEEAESNGDEGTQYRTHFKRQAQLDDGQAAWLEQTAVEYGEAKKTLDACAKTIIDAYKAQFPHGQVFNRPKQPPSELHSLSVERDALVLRKRDQLRSAFGSAFVRFDTFVKTHVPADTPTQAR